MAIIFWRPEPKTLQVHEVILFLRSFGIMIVVALFVTPAQCVF
jgi:hypothetical protein